ncbi:hypothetical protein DCAR_0418190 [Daucus carota subsp. sativus]|uniref:Glycine-rich protein n=1 Tax=Daucus carota subsp. sativus TaxID=79200 RepID=A0A165Z815_DAUCS|nr:PREDICTED: uncharacterized protein LOC108217533 [Daucus carota subsp. sativus]WOG98844.1 hypothetical protein DCAR_0418190 [Daucus carota subsp. sativus]
MKNEALLFTVVLYIVLIRNYSITANLDAPTHEALATEYPVRLRGYERVYGWYPGGYDHKWNHKCHRHHRTGYHNHHDGYKHELGGRSGGRGRRGCKWPGGRGVTKAVSKRGAIKKNP